MKLLDFAKHFDSEEACEKYLKETREKEGIKCSRCGCEKQYWNRYHKRWMCAKCGHETTLRSGTVMHGSNLPCCTGSQPFTCSRPQKRRSLQPRCSDSSGTSAISLSGR